MRSKPKILYVYIFRCFFILDISAPPFDLNLSFYQQQLKKDLVMNVYSDGKWGSYRQLPLDSPATITAPHAWVKITKLGDLSSFKWMEGNINPDRLGSVVCPTAQLLYHSVIY
jgi:hypothetical protein